MSDWMRPAVTVGRKLMHLPWKIWALGGAAAVLLLTGSVTFLIERPTRLSVAVSEADPEDLGLMFAASKLVKSGKHAIRLKLLPVKDASAAAEAIDEGSADLAVVRSDIALPNTGETVVILHRDAALLLAPASGDVHDVAGLDHHRVGILRAGTGNTRLLDAILAQYGLAPEAVTTESLAPGEVADAIRSKKVDAVLAVDVISSQMLADVVKAVTEGGEGPAVFLPITEAAAIAQRVSVYEAMKVVRGAFAGMPTQPSEDYATIGVTHRLMADESVPTDAITDLTRFVLRERLQIGAVAPLALRIEVPSTDKGALNPVHAGAAAYIDDEEETFFDKYSDMIYIGAMMMGVMASGATALWSRMNTRKTQALHVSLHRLMHMLALARSASTVAVLDHLQSEADAILAQAIEVGGPDDERRFAAFGLALAQVHAAISDRRRMLPGASAREPPDHFVRVLAGSP